MSALPTFADLDVETLPDPLPRVFRVRKSDCCSCLAEDVAVTCLTQSTGGAVWAACDACLSVLTGEGAYIIPIGIAPFDITCPECGEEMTSHVIVTRHAKGSCDERFTGPSIPARSISLESLATDPPPAHAREFSLPEKWSWQSLRQAIDYAPDEAAKWCAIAVHTLAELRGQQEQVRQLHQQNIRRKRSIEQGQRHTLLRDRLPLVAVACKDTEGRVWALPKPHRHGDVLRVMHEHGAHQAPDNHYNQGFLDANGLYLHRKAASVNAELHNQIKNGQIIGGVLTSEDLW